jgi:hypothetical protein
LTTVAGGGVAHPRGIVCAEPMRYLERRLLEHASMLTWTELAAYVSVIVTVWSGGLALCYMWLWR